MEIDELLEHFDGVRRNGAGWMVRCPVHSGGEERTPSLGIDEGESGYVFKCHAEDCAITDVLRAVDLRWQDVFFEEQKPEIVATYDYTDADGKLLYQAVRMHPKSFRQRRPDGDGWAWNLDDVERVPYRLDKLPVNDGSWVFITEGEKDADAIAAKGANSTTNSGGAGKWVNGWGGRFEGLNVIVVADKDEPGRKHARQVRDSVAPYAASVKVVEAKVGKDAYDHLAAGCGSKDFVPVDLDEPVYRFTPLDLSEKIPPAVWLLDGLVCMGDATLLYGQPKAGKTWVSLGLAVAVSHGLPFFMGKNVQRHGRVLYIDEEMPRDLIDQRLRKLGLDDSRWRENLRYLWRQGIRLDDTPELILEEAKSFKPALIVIDNLTAMHRGTENDLEGIGSVLRDGVVPLARETGAAVLLLHHSTKSGESPRGHGDIIAAVDSILRLEKDDSEPRRFIVSDRDTRRSSSSGRLTVDIVDNVDGTVQLYAHPAEYR